MKYSGHTSRLWALVIVLLVLVITPFLVWGEWFEQIFDLQGTKQWLESLGSFAWLGGVALLISDLVLPIPGTVVMSALGLVYGWFWGGVASILGSVLSGMIAYWLCRMYGHRAAVWLAGEKGLAKGETLFQSERGGWLVALSRWMPVLPEAVACLAGLTKMPWRTFITALIAGSIPLGFVFAAIGDLGLNRPGIALALSAFIPVVLYALAAWMLRKRKS